MTADRFDVFLCPAASAGVEEALRADGLRVFRGSPFDDFDKIAPELAASRVVLADHPALSGRVVTMVPGEPLPDLVRRVREKAVAGPGCSALWTVHSELVARRAVLVRGLPGAGKTTLAEEYAGLVGRFGGRVLRTGPFGHLDPDDFLPQFHLALAAAAGASEGGFDRLRARLAARIEAAGSRVLVLVDDVPAGVPPGELARVLLPAGPVRTLLTTRAAHWPGATVEVPGLTVAEGLRLLPSAAGFITRCDGHPMTLRAAAFLLRERPGAAVSASVSVSVEELPDTAPHAIREVLVRMGRPACELLRLGSVLAPSPIPAEVAGLGFAAAEEELVAHGFATRVEGGLRLQALAVEVARGEFGQPAAGGVATAVLRGLTGLRGSADVLDLASAAGPAETSLDTAQPISSGPAAITSPPGHPSAAGPVEASPPAAEPSPPGHPSGGGPAETSPAGAPSSSGRPAAITHTYLIQHARTLADHSPAHRVALLRHVAVAHETHGDPAAAGEIHAAILASGEATAADFTAAARVELACGLVPEALAHARRALDAGHRPAALVVAQALDSQGDYAEADRVFWRVHRPAAAEERLHAAKARRLRGHPEEAIALLEPALGAAAELALEHARNLLQAGHAQRAQEVAATLDSPDADVIRAEAALLGHEPADLAATYARRFGIDSPLTLTASVHAARAHSQPRQALATLKRAEPVVRRVLGDDHPLHLRLRHAMGLAHARLREFGRQADLLEGVLGPQLRLLGRTHPETVETRLDLGLALALSGRGPLDRATKLVDDAAREARGNAALATRARAAQEVVRAER
ncbi:hypothetical protein AB0J40_44090 [Amycolatopsis sp. NPDC049691]|uniref:hypothetical protein n=1 Tax=Amycolatopsis sp. NPDC049691 TaxID=3155155 RepID=UPI0034498625